MIALWVVFFLGASSTVHASWKDTEVMALYVKVYNDLNNTESINGIPDRLLQERSQPCDSACMALLYQNMQNATDPADRQWWAMEMQTRSTSGFVAAGENLLTVLESSWTAVHGLNTTHVELAAHLRTILQNVSDGGGLITYNAWRCPNNTIPQRTPQRLNITVGQTNGFQYSIFFNQNHSQMVPPFDDMWACTYGMTNMATGVGVASVGMGCNTKAPGGMATWVEQIGFYEGSTPYRLDPATLYRMIQGN